MADKEGAGMGPPVSLLVSAPPTPLCCSVPPTWLLAVFPTCQVHSHLRLFAWVFPSAPHAFVPAPPSSTWASPQT